MTVGTGEIRVLHVDDDPDFAETAAAFLERENPDVEVVTVADVESALERIETEDVDCVVSDYEMPETDGIAFLETVRERHPDIPFVLFTGRGSEAVASSAISAGVTDYLQKEAGTGQFKLLANRVENAVSQRRAERAVERGDRRLRTVVDHVPHPVFVVDEDLTYQVSNEAHAGIHGHPVAEMEGSRVAEILGEDDAANIREAFDEAVASDEPQRFSEVELEDADGRTRYFDSRLVPFDQVRADRPAVLGVIVDVTDRKERELTLERLHEVTRELLAAASREEVAHLTTRAVREVLGYPQNIVRFVDDEGAKLHAEAASQAALDMLGERPVYSVGDGTAGRAFAAGETLVYDDVSDLDDEYDREAVRAAMYLPIGEYGTLSICETEVGAFDESDVRLAEIFAANAEAALDRVEQARTRDRQNERLEEFASIVSHDLQNPLSVLEISLELAEENGDPEEFARCHRAVDRMEQLISDLMALARDGESVTAVEPVPLDELVEECWAHVESGAATLVVETDQVVEADPRRLRQLLENLLANAVTHGGSSGSREVPAGAVTADDAATVRVGALPDGFFVADDGPGVPADDRERIFESGYSTADGGSGFGLAIVQQIADAHGWHISVTDAVEAGENGDTGTGTAGGPGARFEVRGVATGE